MYSKIIVSIEFDKQFNKYNITRKEDIEEVSSIVNEKSSLVKCYFLDGLIKRKKIPASSTTSQIGKIAIKCIRKPIEEVIVEPPKKGVTITANRARG